MCSSLYLEADQYISGTFTVDVAYTYVHRTIYFIAKWDLEKFEHNALRLRYNFWSTSVILISECRDIEYEMLVENVENMVVQNKS